MSHSVAEIDVSEKLDKTAAKNIPALLLKCSFIKIPNKFKQIMFPEFETGERIQINLTRIP